MSYRSSIPNAFIRMGRSIGKAIGCEIAVEISEHSIQTKMEVPDKDKRAWDKTMFKSGNLFVQGYANPIKPRVENHEGLDDKDRVDVQESEQQQSDGHAELISSPRYRRYMIQDLVSQLLTPETKWRQIMYVVLGVLILQVASIFIGLSAAGVL